MGKFALVYECFGLQARFWNELCSQTKVPLYFFVIIMYILIVKYVTKILYYLSVETVRFHFVRQETMSDMFHCIFTCVYMCSDWLQAG
jgi:hypothetical protein